MVTPDAVLQLVRSANPVIQGDPPAYEAIAARIVHVQPTASPRHPRRRRRPLLALVPVVLILSAGALAAGGVIRLGAPVKEPATFNPNSNFGGLSKGTVRLLSLATHDPHGGPAWGMRIYSTTQGIGCIQVGRLLYGKLGALGQDGAFSDDGRFHPIPLPRQRLRGCTVLDGHGRIFLNVTATNVPASVLTTCIPASANAIERTAPNGKPALVCPQADERNLYYGLLGPDATSVTYVLDGQRRTQATVGAEGAYLIVVPSPRNQLLNGVGGGTTDVVPVDGPITELHYRGGETCHLTARSWIGGRDSCTPALNVPLGWVEPRAPRIAAAQVAAPVRATLIHARRAGTDTGPAGYELQVSFKARVAVTNSRSAYTVSWHEQPEPSQVRSGANTPYNVRAGQTVTVRGGRYPTLRAGLIEGTVTFLQDNGPGSIEEGPGTAALLVGRFTIRVP